MKEQFLKLRISIKDLRKDLKFLRSGINGAEKCNIKSNFKQYALKEQKNYKPAKQEAINKIEINHNLLNMHNYEIA